MLEVIACGLLECVQTALLQVCDEIALETFDIGHEFHYGCDLLFALIELLGVAIEHVDVRADHEINMDDVAQLGKGLMLCYE